jgi:hypothetical protein
MQKPFERKSFECPGVVIVIDVQGKIIDSTNPLEMWDKLESIDWRYVTLVDERYNLSSGWERKI